MTSPAHSAGLRLAFMGTPEFAVPALAALIDAGHEIVAVYTQPPRAAGRGYKRQPSPVHRAAESHRLAVHTPTRLKGEDEIAEWRSLGLDAAVVVAYGVILPETFLEAPRLGCINIHASLLPRWRGAAPIQRAIMAGDQETGITLMQMDAGLDSGPILAQKRQPIAGDATAGELHDALAEMGAAMIAELLPALDLGEITPVPQPDTGITYAPKVTKLEARIDWQQSATQIDRLVRALNPTPGAWFPVDDMRIKVWRGAPVQRAQYSPPGTVIRENGDLGVACGDGTYRLIELQRAGRRRALAAEFLRGATLEAGRILD